MIVSVPSVDPPTMSRFTWSPITSQLRPLPGDGWCVRDAFCQLLGWPVGSLEWTRFVEDPGGPDLYRLIDHLGLEWFDPAAPQHQAALADRLDHPGIFLYGLTYPDPLAASGVGHRGHVTYQPHLRRPQPLPLRYQAFQPDLVNVIVDTRQPPRPR
jgi:hypothetical protein